MQTQALTQPPPQSLSGEGCRARRLALGVSQAELAQIALVDPTTIWRLEHLHTVRRVTRQRIEAALRWLEEEGSS